MGGHQKKTGKGRLDRFYHLAKEQGYRARSAFKLIQLAKKFNFLANATSLVDLCGAPGGWSQVAVKSMPAGSKILCVDLSPIKPIKGVITIQGDITSDHTRSIILREVRSPSPSSSSTAHKTNKSTLVDVVLNDGAPNVGANWNRDAYNQLELSLCALKLATEILRPGGTFVTKVFRSSDYPAFLWVLNKLFKKVSATKPSSSRDVSAELFVVCQDFLPQSIDPKLLDPKHVFMLDSPSPSLSLPGGEGGTGGATNGKGKVTLRSLLREKFAQKRNRAGYETGDDFSALDLRTWVLMEDEELAARALVKANCIKPGNPADAKEFRFEENEELKGLMQDLKVLNLGDYLKVGKWREEQRKRLGLANKKSNTEQNGKEADSGEEEADSGEEEGSDSGVEELVEKRKREERREKRRERERLKKAKTRQKMSMSGEFGAEEEPDLFSLKQVVMGDEGEGEGEGEEEEGMESGNSDVEMGEYEVLGEEGKLERMEAELEAHWERRKRGEGKKEEKKTKERRRDLVTAEWAKEMTDFTAEVRKKAGEQNFSKLVQATAEDSDLDSEDEAKIIEMNDARAARFFDNPLFKKSEENLADDNSEVDKELSDSELPELPLCDKKQKKLKKSKKGSRKTDENDEEAAAAADTQFEVVPVSVPTTASFVTAPESAEDAMDIQSYGSLLITKKSRIAAIEAGYHRYAYDEDEEAAANLPEWFREEEKRFTQPSIPLTKELAAQMRAKIKEINARPIRKVQEALGRKQKRAQLKLEKIRKQATSLSQAEDVGGITKTKEIAKAVSKMKRDEKRKVVYTVVSHKGAPGKQVSKGKAGKGAKVKVVDRRLKKDNRAAKRAAKRK